MRRVHKMMEFTALRLCPPMVKYRLSRLCLPQGDSVVVAPLILHVPLQTSKRMMLWPKTPSMTRYQTHAQEARSVAWHWLSQPMCLLPWQTTLGAMHIATLCPRQAQRHPDRMGCHDVRVSELGTRCSALVRRCNTVMRCSTVAALLNAIC